MALSMHVDPFAVEDPSELPDWRLPLSFMKSRHTEKIKGDELSEDSWRMKDRMKTWSVALVLCLNIGVDPPDVVKTDPCARKECWIGEWATYLQVADYRLNKKRGSPLPATITFIPHTHTHTQTPSP